MRFAAIADIHGNCAALEAVLADIAAQGIADIVNLGDVASGPLHARRTIELLMQRNIVTVRGNHDRYLVEQPPEKMGSWERPAFAELDAGHLDWLRALPASLVFRDDVFACHATPDDDEIYWLETVHADGAVALAPLDVVVRRAGDVPQSLMLCGHSHLPRAVRLPDGRMIVNPGSVGCPGYRDITPVRHVVQTGTPDASYAILDRGDDGWQVTFRQVRYDHRAMADLARQRGRPEWADVLATGWMPPPQS
ncbi:metallophosphoesterase family protein [Bradyrhizobium sp. 2TAF24]|uniref:metallophosphoesterase family protein n=1 Tax=Bradyrhizobium sp. 2TAF24 TaxID=3233011 RepID=UPI003F8F5549